MLTLIRKLGIKPHPKGKTAQSWVLVQCSYCGQEVERQQGNIKNKSCGCMAGELLRQSKTTHGESGPYGKAGQRSVLYSKWANMKKRCSEFARVKDYHIYYGKGIRVCLEWHKFENFRDWAVSNGFDPKLEIDRIDNSKGYEPSNCRWVTPLENIRNKTTSTMTVVKAISIRMDYSMRVPRSDLCKKYKENKNVINMLLAGRTWKDAVFAG